MPSTTTSPARARRSPLATINRGLPRSISSHQFVPLSLRNIPHPSPEQGEHQVAGISPEFAAVEEERRRRLEPPQEELPVPGESLSSTSSFAPIADTRLSPGEPPTTPTEPL